MNEKRIDKTKTRQAVRAYFAVYRKFVFLLEAGTVPREELRPVPGYEDAADPDSIHAPGFNPGGVKVIDGKLRYMAWFVQDVQRTVRRLPKYQRDIMFKQYMGREQLTNDETYQALVDDKWYVSRRYFDENKTEAMDLLAEVWSLEVYVKFP
ncbi:hypothetical protein AAC03nite_28260 [Alicyclobacillus acidoterrestris]|nr:hypothetical protein AAC03nite_28260 [Alicyclobacillus acidoterrestris]